jgi:hypothetical protein
MWQATVISNSHQVFGLFDGALLVGITANVTSKEARSGQSCRSFSREGFSRMLYDACLGWVWAHSKFRRVIISSSPHVERTSPANLSAIRFRTCVIRGKPMGRSPRMWPGDTTEDEIICELRLAPRSPLVMPLVLMLTLP